MRNYFIKSFKITKLWGYREDIDLTFNNDVNVLIGPNASGKTTILNLLHSILSADLRGILNINFEQTEIKLKEFNGRTVRKITAKCDTTDRTLKLGLGKNELSFNIDTISNQRFPEHHPFFERGSYGMNTLIRAAAGNDIDVIIRAEEFYNELTDSVPIVWLPVSRHLPVTEGEEERYTRTQDLESVDLRLEELLEGLFHYHSRLNARLSERYKKFERQVLSVILYSKDQDKPASISLPSPKRTNTDKKQLLGAFEEAGLLDEQMQNRINEHFAKSEEVVNRVRKASNDLTPEDFLVLPLISRTQDMVKCAAELEKDREDIFDYLRRYEETVNSFFHDKSILVDESGQLKIESSSPSDLNHRLLSSGEKQILILLTQALLKVDEPVVYIADEPELSLHVKWQEKFLESLVTLGGQKQIIVATHSPDIVGDFRDKVIDLGRES